MLTDIPEEIITKYKLHGKAVPDGYNYIEICKGMSGLSQQELFEKWLIKTGYHQSKIAPGLWKNETWCIKFALVIDDFSVKFVVHEQAQCSLECLKEYYEASAD